MPPLSKDRLERIYSAVAQRDGDTTPRGRLKAACRACVDLLPVTGSGIMLMAERAHQGTLHATDQRISQLEELQNATAEGPCIDSYNLGRPVLEPDLADQGLRTWPLLARAALDAGIAALFSFPLQLDDTSVGALNLYRDRPGPLTPDQTADARLLAAVAAREVLSLQAEATPGSLPDQIGDLSGDRAAIEQATGMASAQLEIAIPQAAAVLRERARAEGRPLAEVARAIVARALRLS